MSQPANYYATPAADPILCLLVDDYVWEVGEETCKPRSRYAGQFVMLQEVRVPPVTDADRAWATEQARALGLMDGDEKPHL